MKLSRFLLSLILCALFTALSFDIYILIKDYRKFEISYNLKSLDITKAEIEEVKSRLNITNEQLNLLKQYKFTNFEIESGIISEYVINQVNNVSNITVDNINSIELTEEEILSAGEYYLNIEDVVIKIKKYNEDNEVDQFATRDYVLYTYLTNSYTLQMELLEDDLASKRIDFDEYIEKKDSLNLQTSKLFYYRKDQINLNFKKLKLEFNKFIDLKIEKLNTDIERDLIQQKALKEDYLFNIKNLEQLNENNKNQLISRLLLISIHFFIISLLVSLIRLVINLMINLDMRFKISNIYENNKDIDPKLLRELNQFRKYYEDKPENFLTKSIKNFFK